MKNIEYPKISIVVPCFNMANFLPSLFESIIEQNYNNVEVIVIDGGSVDETADIVEMYSALVSKFISEPDNGQADAVTKGLRLATGDIHHWHAADDILLPDALWNIANASINKPEAALFISDGIAFGHDFVCWTGRCKYIAYRTSLFHFDRFQSDCCYWRASLTTAALPLDVSMPLTVDEDFLLRLWAGKSHFWINTPLGAFRQHGNQVSQLMDKSSVEKDRASIRAKIYNRDGLSAKKVFVLMLLTYPEYIIRCKFLASWERVRTFIYSKIGRDSRKINAAIFLEKDWIWPKLK